MASNGPTDCGPFLSPQHSGTAMTSVGPVARPEPVTRNLPP